ICMITTNISESQTEVFMKDMKTLYANNHDKRCVFIGTRPLLEPDFALQKEQEKGYATVISEQFDSSDKKKLTVVLNEFIHAKKVDENISDLDSSLKLILA